MPLAISNNVSREEKQKGQNTWQNLLPGTEFLRLSAVTPADRLRCRLRRVELLWRSKPRAGHAPAITRTVASCSNTCSSITVTITFKFTALASLTGLMSCNFQCEWQKGQNAWQNGGGVVVRALDLLPIGHSTSQTTPGKLFTRMCLCSPSWIWAVMLCGL